MKETDGIDWTGVNGPDDFSDKVKQTKDASREEIVAAAKELIGDEQDKSTNAGQLRWLAESSIEEPPEPGESGYTVVLDLLKLADESGQVYDDEERARRMAINREALDYFYDRLRVDREKAIRRPPIEYGDHVEVETLYPAGGFVFIESARYPKGQNITDDTLPRAFFAEAHSLVDGEPKGGIFYIVPKKSAAN